MRTRKWEKPDLMRGCKWTIKFMFKPSFSELQQKPGLSSEVTGVGVKTCTVVITIH